MHSIPVDRRADQRRSSRRALRRSRSARTAAGRSACPPRCARSSASRPRSAASVRHGAFPLCWSVAHIGPMTTSVRDCARTYGLIAGPDPAGRLSLAHPAVEIDDAPAADLRGVTLGVYWPWFRHAAPERRAALRVARARARGARRRAPRSGDPGTRHDARRAHRDHHRRDGGRHDAATTASTGAISGWMHGSTSPPRAARRPRNTERPAHSHERHRGIPAGAQAVDAIVTPATGIVAPRVDPVGAAARRIGSLDDHRDHALRVPVELHGTSRHQLPCRVRRERPPDWACRRSAGRGASACCFASRRRRSSSSSGRRRAAGIPLLDALT